MDRCLATLRAAPNESGLGLVRRADLAGASLTGVDLTGADLTGADLTGATLGATFAEAVLICANLTGVDLRGAILTGADPTGTYCVEYGRQHSVTPRDLKRAGAPSVAGMKGLPEDSA